MEIIIFLLGIILLEVSYLVYKSSARPGLLNKDEVLLDTSALMDGRIVTAAQTGFTPARLVVPRSVINELQLLADQADHEKRSRARRGLDAVKELQDMPHVKVHVIEDGTVGQGGVDERLIELAKRRHAAMCTIDFNLNKAATALGVRVLNINELAGSLRMAFLPGETISLALTQKGQSGNQAVGYLADGTMVVVDKAGSMVGQTAEIEFVRSLQTSAGRMMFAKLTADPAKGAKATPKAVGRSPLKQPKSSPRSKSKDTAALKPSSRRKTNEDSLIDLVNNQES